MRIHSMAAVVLLATAAPSVDAVQTQVLARECANCSAAQMLAQAKNNPPGVVFIYDVRNHVVRKYDVFIDSTCGPQPVDQPETRGRTPTQDSDGAGTDCGPFRNAVPMTPIDPDMQDAFDALYQTWLYNPTLANLGKARSRDNIPRDPSTNRPFNMADVAWQYPQGSYVRFRDTLWDMLSNRATANAFVDGLGDYLYGFKVGSINAGIVLSGGAGGTVTIAWDRGGTVRLEICNDALDCAKFTVTTNASGLATLNFEGVYDNEQNLYPAESGLAPGNLNRFRFQSPLFAEHFAGQLRPYIPIPYNTCGGLTWLNTVRRGGTIIFQSWECAPAN